MSENETPTSTWPTTRDKEPDPLIMESLRATTAKNEGVPAAGRITLAAQAAATHGLPISCPGLM